MARDMTRGNIAGTLMIFSIPLILSGLLQQLYSWADSLIVGNICGEASLGAIGATGTVSTMFTMIIAGFAVGVSILASHAYGEGDYPSVTKIASTFTLCVTVASIALTAVAIVLGKPLLLALETPADILDEAYTYLMIIYPGVPAMAIYNIYSAVLRGIGDSRTPFYSILVSSLCNVGLDILFVAGFGWGVAGAASATILSQIVMCLFLVLYSTKKYKLLRFSIGRGMMDKDILKQGLKLSIPTAVQSGIRSIGGLLLQNIMNSFGSQTVAAVTTAYRIDSVAMLPVINLGSGIATFTAQNVGAGEHRRTRKGLTVGSILSVLISAALVAVIIPLGATLMRLFGVSEEAVAIGRDLLFILAAFYPVFALLSALTGYLQGMDDVFFVGVVSIAGLGMRIGLSYLLAPSLGRMVIGYAELISWVSMTIVSAIRIHVKFGRKREVDKTAG